MITFFPVEVASDEDKKWIEVALRAHRDNASVTVGDVEELMKAQKAQLWHLSTDIGHGIIVTQVFKDDKELFIWLVAGEKLRDYGAEALMLLERFAKALGLTHIRGVATEKMKNLLVERGGCQVESYNMVKEI